MNKDYHNIRKHGRTTKQEFNQIILKISSILLLLFMGLRHSSIGRDTSSYCEDYLLYQHYNLNRIFKLGTNYGFYIFNKLISLLFPNNYTAYLFIVALITVFALYCFLKKNSNNIFLSEVLLLSLGFIYFFMTGIKQTLAMSILLFAYEELKKQHILKFIGMVLLASLFHNTAIIFIVALFVKKLKFKMIYLALTPLFLVLAYKYQKQIFIILKLILQDEYYVAYGTDYLSSNNLTGLMIQICIFSFCMILLWRRLKYDEEALDLLLLYTIGMFFQAMTFVMAEFFRMSMYFSIFAVVMMPKALSVKVFKQQKFISSMICIVFIMYFLFFSSNDPDYIPYHFFWELQ